MTISDVVLPKPDEELIRRKEKAWRVHLPKDYRNFLKEYSGGTPSKKSLPCAGYIYVVERFLCLVKDIATHKYGYLDIDVTVTQIEDRLTDNEDLIGYEMIPIAAMFAGDYLCLDFRKSKRKPSICIWFHEESGELEPVTEKVADSFTEFMQMLV